MTSIVYCGYPRPQAKATAAAAASGASGRTAATLSGGVRSFAVVYLLLGVAYAVAVFCRSTTNNFGWARGLKGGPGRGADGRLGAFRAAMTRGT